MIDSCICGLLFDSSKVTRIHTYDIVKRKNSKYYIYMKFDGDDEFKIWYRDKEERDADYTFLRKDKYKLLTDNEKLQLKEFLNKQIVGERDASGTD